MDKLMWVGVFIIILLLLLIIILLSGRASSSASTIKTGSPFPKKNLKITNVSTVAFTSVDLVDSLGHAATLDDDFKLAPNASMIITLASIPKYGSVQFSAVKGDEDVKMVLFNNNGQVFLIPLLNSDPTVIKFESTTAAATKECEMVYDDNTTYAVRGGDLLENGDDYPDRFVFTNNTTGDSRVLTNSHNTDGTNPNLDVVFISSFYVGDSQDNTYVDTNLPESISFAPDNKTSKSSLSIGARPMMIQFDTRILHGENVQIYFEDQNSNYTVVLLNLNKKVFIIYPPNISPSAITLRKASATPKDPVLKTEIPSDVKIRYSIHEPCRSLQTETQHVTKEYQAVFDIVSIWTANQMDPPMTDTAMGTLKVGFLDGKPWQWAWIAKCVQESIPRFAGIDFNFVFPLDPVSYDPNNPNPILPEFTRPIDKDNTYHIRITFNPTGGAYSYLGNRSIINRRYYAENPNEVIENTMNFGWMDAPLDTIFSYDNITYKTDANFPQGGYPGLGTTVIHEFCHALGMQHEHQNPRGTNPNLDSGVPWNFNKAYLKEFFGGPPNNWTSDDITHQILKALSKDTTNGSTFDNASIMRYSFPSRALVDATRFPCIDQPPLVLSSCDKHWLKQSYPGRRVVTNCVPGPDAFCPTASNPNPTPAPNSNIQTVSYGEDPIIISNQPTVDCAVSEWSEWSNCSAQCGIGSKTRTRTIVTKPTNDGAICPVLVQTQDCNTNACPYTIIPWQTIARRKQWDGNFGYCGETSYIAAAMHYGMYISQYDLRRYTSITNTQVNETDQVLLGEKSEIAALNLFKLNYEQWRNSSMYCRQSNSCEHTDVFCNWAQAHLNKGRPVISVVYTKPGKSPVYDHIISLLQSTTTTTELGPPKFIIWDNYAEPVADPPTGLVTNPFIYDYPAIKRTRAQATAAADDYSLPSGRNYGTAITGINSTETSLVRIQLVGNPNREEPEIVDKTGIRPASTVLTLTLHLYNLQPNVTYHLYRYKNPLLLPTANFNQTYNDTVGNGNTTDIIREVIAASATPQMDTILTRTMTTSDIALYRCVPSTAN
jgi:hypothetical protein